MMMTVRVRVWMIGVALWFAAATVPVSALETAAAADRIVARETCPARDPDYADYRSRQMANYRQEAKAAKSQGLAMSPPTVAEVSILSEAEYLARGAPGSPASASPISAMG
jgi:hypothetical protein